MSAHDARPLSPAKLIPPEHILIDLDQQSKKRVFEQVGLLFENTLGLPRGEVFASLLARERLGSTGIGGGSAIPHGRMAGLRAPACALVRMKNPIPFDAPDDAPVKNMLILLAPGNANAAHLQALALFSQMLSDRPFADALAQCENAGAAHDLIAQWQEKREQTPAAAGA